MVKVSISGDESESLASFNSSPKNFARPWLQWQVRVGDWISITGSMLVPRQSHQLGSGGTRSEAIGGSEPRDYIIKPFHFCSFLPYDDSDPQLPYTHCAFRLQNSALSIFNFDE